MTSVPSPTATVVPRRAMAHLMAASALLLDVGFVLLVVETGAGGPPHSAVTTVGGFLLGITFPAMGWVIASKRPANAIGWIFLGVGLSQALATFAGQYATVGLITTPGSLPAADVMAWLNTWVWAPGFDLLLTASVLLFPDGQPPSPRWRVVLWAAAASVALVVLPYAVVAWPARGVDLLGPGPSAADAANPVFGWFLMLTNAGLVLLLLASAASIAGLVARFRRSAGAVRAQLKWFAAAGLVEITMLVVTSLVPFPAWFPSTLLAAIAAPLLPIAAAIAIVRYRLYDIDRIISRTLSYAVVTAALAAVFAMLVLALQAALAGATQGETLAVAASTLAAFALFQPLRRRVQSVVDRRFNRARVDAEAALVVLAAHLRDETDLERVAQRVEAAANSALAPAGVALWTRGR